jgi:hypothetical protein
MIVYTQDYEGYKRAYKTNKLELLKDDEKADMMIFTDLDGKVFQLPIEDLCFIES